MTKNENIRKHVVVVGIVEILLTFTNSVYFQVCIVEILLKILKETLKVIDFDVKNIINTWSEIFVNPKVCLGTLFIIIQDGINVTLYCIIYIKA